MDHLDATGSHTAEIVTPASENAAPKINSLQKSVLLRLRKTGPCSAYQLRARLGTLNALGLKKLVSADRSRPGSFAMPSTSIVWTITDDGAARIAHLDDDGLCINRTASDATKVDR